MKSDPLELILCAIGLGLIYVLVVYWNVDAGTIWKFLTRDI